MTTQQDREELIEYLQRYAQETARRLMKDDCSDDPMWKAAALLAEDGRASGGLVGYVTVDKFGNPSFGEPNYDGAFPVYTHPQPAQVAPVTDGWIPVEQQMPKSGQIVLALQKWDHSGKLGIIRAAWLAAKTEESSPESDIGEYDEATDTYYEPEGWYEQISHWDEYSAAGVSGATIVAWMPLPAAMLSAAPKVQETGA